jgi:hypothetical protein
MQLKKRFSVRKSVAAGAMAVAMFATSMPAMASNGLGIGLGLEARGGRLMARGDDDREGRENGGSDEAKGLQAQIKTELKAIKTDLKASSKLQVGSATSSATGTGSVEARKQCRKAAQTAYAAALEDAREERDAGLKAAREKYLAALKAARDAFHVSLKAVVSGSVTGSASGTASATGTAQVDLRTARKTYQEAVKKAQQDFRDAKRAVSAAYHADTKAAREAHKTSTVACKS